MGEEPSPNEFVCEVCAKTPVERDNLLCPDCARAFTLVLELVHSHPELDAADLDRIREVFEWRLKKTRFLPSEPLEVKPQR